LVRAEGARFGLADPAALEPDAPAALADERRVGEQQRWRSKDDAPPREHEQERWPQSDREARHGSAQDDREAQHREAQDRGEAQHREARRPKDRTPSHRGALDREAHDAPELDPKEEALTERYQK
jgi:hypothetical protein